MSMRKILAIGLLAIVVVSCTYRDKTAGTMPSDIIPAPVEFSVRPGIVRSDETLRLPEKVRISDSSVRRLLKGRELADWQLKSAYWLEVGKKGIKIVAADEEGVFYARQSLKMMASLDSSVTCCTILDWPSYRHRGTIAERDHDTRDLALEHSGRRSDRTSGEFLRIADDTHGSGQVLLLGLGTVTQGDRLLEHLHILGKDDVDDRAAVNIHVLGRVAEARDFQDSI